MLCPFAGILEPGPPTPSCSSNPPAPTKPSSLKAEAPSPLPLPRRSRLGTQARRRAQGGAPGGGGACAVPLNRAEGAVRSCRGAAAQSAPVPAAVSSWRDPRASLFLRRRRRRRWRRLQQQERAEASGRRAPWRAADARAEAALPPRHPGSSDRRSRPAPRRNGRRLRD